MEVKYDPGNYLKFDNNFGAMLKDALQGDNKILDLPEFQALGVDNIKAALKWFTETDLNGDYKNLIANEGWRLMYKRKPPTPEEYLTPEWIGGQAEGLWPNVRKAFVEFMNPNPLNPRRGLALSTSIGWGKQNPISSYIVVDKTVDLELENGKTISIPYNTVLTVLVDGKPKTLKAEELLSEDLEKVDFPEEVISEFCKDRGRSETTL